MSSEQSESKMTFFRQMRRKLTLLEISLCLSNTVYEFCSEHAKLADEKELQNKARTLNLRLCLVLYCFRRGQTTVLSIDTTPTGSVHHFIPLM